MKYFREYPWGLQAILFVLMVFTMLSAASAVIMSVLPRATGFSLEQIQTVSEQSPAALINAAIAVQGFGSVLAYMTPALLFAYLSHPQPRKYLGLVRPGKNIQWMLAVCVILGAMPVLSFIAELLSKIDLGPALKAEQEANDHIMGAFLKMPTFTDFLICFVVMAIIPALGEELFFRGVLMRLARKRTKTMVVPVVFTAIIFSLSHTNVYGYLSIFLAGVLLAAIYYLTGSIWCSILAHLAFNGTQVILAYIGNFNPAMKDFATANSTPLPLVLTGVVVFGVSFYLLMKNKTPLADNWANDFEKPASDFDSIDA